MFKNIQKFRKKNPKNFVQIVQEHSKISEKKIQKINRKYLKIFKNSHQNSPKNPKNFVLKIPINILEKFDEKIFLFTYIFFVKNINFKNGPENDFLEIC